MNLRPLEPHSSTLPNCATPRYMPLIAAKIIILKRVLNCKVFFAAHIGGTGRMVEKIRPLESHSRGLGKSSSIRQQQWIVPVLGTQKIPRHAGGSSLLKNSLGVQGPQPLEAFNRRQRHVRWRRRALLRKASLQEQSPVPQAQVVPVILEKCKALFRKFTCSSSNTARSKARKTPALCQGVSLRWSR